MTTHATPSRRSLLGAAAAGSALLATPTSYAAAAAGPAGGPAGGRAVDLDRELAALEERHERRLGIFARDLRSGRTVAHRADERFAICSTFKTLVVAAVLDGRLTTPDRDVLDRRAVWPPSLVAGAGYAPRLQAWQDAAYAPTVREVCEATQADSDNAGGNWLLQEVGGPAALTAFARSLGDRTSDLSRWEPALNDWAPGQETDATTPRAIGLTHARLLLGRTLAPRHRRLLTTWMLGNRTGDDALRAGLPDGWTIAEKTGSGARGTRNDVGVAWTPRGRPVLISCLTRAEQPDAPTTDAPLEDVARLVAEALG